MKIEICFANTKLLLDNQDQSQLKALQECIKNKTLFRMVLNDKVYYINAGNICYLISGE